MATSAIRGVRYVGALIGAIAAVLIAVPPVSAPTAAASTLAIRPGVYRGTVLMGDVAIGYGYGIFPFTGHFTLSVSKTDTLTGTEGLIAGGPFPVKPSCTNDPARWLVQLSMSLGQGGAGLIPGQPGIVRGSLVHLYVQSSGTKSSPNTYVNSCPGGFPNTTNHYTFNNFATSYGDLSWGPISHTVTVPVSFFQRVGSSQSIGVWGVLGKKKFTQRLVLTSRP